MAWKETLMEMVIVGHGSMGIGQNTKPPPYLPKDKSKKTPKPEVKRVAN